MRIAIDGRPFYSLSSTLYERGFAFDPRILAHPSPDEYCDIEGDFSFEDEPGLPIELEDLVPTCTANHPYPPFGSGELLHDQNNQEDHTAISQSVSEQFPPST